MMDAQYHYSVRSEKTIPMWQNVSERLSKMIDRMSPITMEFVHVKTQEEYNVVVMALELTRGFKPYLPDNKVSGDRYVSVEDKFIPYYLTETFVSNNANRIIEFEDFIKEAI